MGDNRKIRDPQDRKRIKLDQPSNVACWCEKFECTVDELKAAVEAAGTTFADEVEVEIQRIKARRLRPPGQAASRSRSSDSGWSR